MLDLYKNIKKYRLERQLTQSQLADLVGYSDKGMISRIENGKVDLPQSQIAKFASALGVSPSDLMGWDGKSQITLSKDDYQKFTKIISSLMETEILIPEALPKIPLSDDEITLIKLYRKADPETQIMVKRMLVYSEKYKEEEDNNG